MAVSVASAAVRLAHFCFASAAWLSAMYALYFLNWFKSSRTMAFLSPDFIAIVASVMCD
jgi:hypothetical protein